MEKSDYEVSNSLSVDRKQGVNSFGERFVVGELITFEGSDRRVAVILSFGIDEDEGVVVANTDIGSFSVDRLMKSW